MPDSPSSTAADGVGPGGAGPGGAGPGGAAPRLRVSVVLVGDELLDGWVTDRNASWLAPRLAALEVPLDRIHVVPDGYGPISEALGAELSRSRPRVVITSGGIGTTPDDLTNAAVARHLGRDLVAHPEISARIDRVIERTAVAGHPIDDDEAEVIRRMALVPGGARVLAASTGMVPGVVVDVDGGSDTDGGASIVVLPGVPEQFREIMERAVEPALLAGRGVHRHTDEFIHDHPESAFTGVLDRLARERPGLVVGSYPGDDVVIRLKGDEQDVGYALALLGQRSAELENDAAAVGRRDAWRARRRT